MWVSEALYGADGSPSATLGSCGLKRRQRIPHGIAHSFLPVGKLRYWLRPTDGGCLHSWQISCRRCCSCCRCYWCCCCCCMFFLCSAAGETLSTVSPVYFRRTCQQVTGRDHAECCRLKSIFLILLACPTELWHLQSCRRTFASRGNRKTDVERHAKRKRWYKHEIMNREIITGCCSNGSERISIAKHNFLWLINWHIAIF